MKPNTSSQGDNIKDASGYWSSSSDDVTQGKSRLTARDQGQPVIAFGSTIRVDKKKKMSTSSHRERKDSSSSYLSGFVNIYTVYILLYIFYITIFRSLRYL